MPGIGIPKAEEVLPPIIKRNYGKWTGHDFIKAGVYKHISQSGEECYTVRVGMPPNARVSTDTLYKICDLADKYAEGYFRVTTRNHIEFVGVEKERIDRLIKDLNKMGLPVGGTHRRFHQTMSCSGWIHCQIAATDSPSIAKVISDMLYEEFVSKEEPYPAMLKISVSGCMAQCGMGSNENIGIVGVYRETPEINEEIVKPCQSPTTFRACPTGAIRPKGKYSVQINPVRCVCCGCCTMACEALTMKYPTAGVAIVVGGKAGNTGAGPAWAKMVIPYLPNNPPRWPEVTDAVKKIIEVWVKDARKDERIGDWIARIGWERFFKQTGFPISDKHIDGLRGGLSNVHSNVCFNW